MITTALAQQIKDKIDSSNKILLVSHKKPDGDALGAICAISRFLHDHDKEHHIYNNDEIAAQYQFLPFLKQISNSLEEVKQFTPDLIIILDTGDLKHAGIENIIDELKNPYIINIDHHPTNAQYGHINIVDENAVATSELIYRLFSEINYKINREIATCLLTGILFDTNNFTNPNTTFFSLKIASKLVTLGARMPEVNNNTIRNKNLPTLQLWGEVLSRLKHNPELNIVTTIITKKDIKKYKVGAEVTDGLSNFLNNLSDVNASIILKEEDEGYIKGSMRTNSDLVDLSKLAKMLGGGGHRKASGFLIKGKLKETATGWEII